MLINRNNSSVDAVVFYMSHLFIREKNPLKVLWANTTVNLNTIKRVIFIQKFNLRKPYAKSTVITNNIFINWATWI